MKRRSCPLLRAGHPRRAPQRGGAPPAPSPRPSLPTPRPTPSPSWPRPAGVGAIVGRGAWIDIEATRHHPNEFVVLVGESARARKGSSWDHVARVLGHANPTLAGRTRTGLSTGEGLIRAARDPHGADPGCPDGRILVVEPSSSAS